MTGSYLVTGSAGFIGGRVAQLLLANDDEVTGIDNFNDAYDVRVKEWRHRQLEAQSRYTFLRADICDLDGLRSVFASSRFDAVINLAARAGVRPSVEEPRLYYETNLIGTLNLLEMCRANGVPKFVQASSASVYGVDNPMPYREDVATELQISPYAASKKAAEGLCYTYHHLHGIDVTVFRYFTVYGPAGRPDMMPFRLVQWIGEGRPVVVYGDGMQSRDFTYVDDIAKGTIGGLKSLGYEIINLGSDRPVKLMHTIHIVEDLMGSKAAIEYREPHAADVPATWADIGKAERLLGWRPKSGIEQGLRNLVAWYRENREWAKDVVTL